MSSRRSSIDSQDSLLVSLISAVQDGQLSTVEGLIEAGCDVTQPDSHNWTPLTHALAEGRWDIFQMLSKAHCRHDLRSRKKTERMVAAIEERAYKKVIKLVGDGHFFKDFTEQERMALIFLAINHSCPPDVLAALLGNERTDFTMRYHCGMTPLVLATVIGNHETLEAVLTHMPDLYTPDILRKSAVPYAIEKGCSKCLELLLKNADVENKRALENHMKLAIARGQGTCLSVLLKWSRSRGLYTEGEGYLHIAAASSGSLECLDILFDYGFDASRCNSLGETALMYAVINGHLQCLDRLLQHDVPIPIDAVDFEGNTALMHAVQRVHPECVTRLLKHGADVNLVTASRTTSISMACCQSSIDILQRLLTNSKNVRPCFHDMAFKLSLKFYNIHALVLLMENGIFFWRWMDDLKDLDGISPEPIAKAAVASGTSPGHFRWQKQTMTLLKFALYFNNYETVQFLLANHYLADYDVRILPRDDYFISSVRAQGNPNTVRLLNQLISQPWSLQTLSFLTILSAINASAIETDSPRRRNVLVEQLPLPQKFTTKLMFRGAVSQMCVDQWEKIGVHSQVGGIPTEVNLFSNESPMWKDSHASKECEKGKCRDNDEGFRIRFQMLRYRRQ